MSFFLLLIVAVAPQIKLANSTSEKPEEGSIFYKEDGKKHLIEHGSLVEIIKFQTAAYYSLGHPKIVFPEDEQYQEYLEQGQKVYLPLIRFEGKTLRAPPLTVSQKEELTGRYFQLDSHPGAVCHHLRVYYLDWKPISIAVRSK